MKVLILSCGTGGGYTAVALAVKEKLEEHGHEVTVLDLNSLVGESLFRVRWNLFRYRKDDKSEYRIQQYLQENEFEVIIATHIVPAAILSLLHKGHVPLPKVVYVAADYSSMPFAEELACDHYVIPSEKLTAEFCRKGIAKEKILPAGIPVGKDFLTGQSHDEAREEAGVGKEEYGILLWAENIRAEKLIWTVKSIQRYLGRHPQARLVIGGIRPDNIGRRLTAVCSGDARIRLVPGIADRAMYMKACDVMISGSGGLLAAEAAVVGIPFIQLMPSIGIERHNAEFFSRYGMSIAVKRPGKRLIGALEDLADKKICDEMVKAQRFHISRLAAVEICNLVESPMINVETGIAGLLV